LTGKFIMPNNFYQRVLELEREIERLKENTPEPVLKGLMSLYSEAIEYFGYIDQVDRCGELQMRMQSILVRPYVLECLNKFEKKHHVEEVKAKKSPKAKKPEGGFFNKKRHLGNAPGVKQLDDDDSDTSFESEKLSSTESSSESEGEIIPVNLCRRATKLLTLKDIDPFKLNSTPKAWYNTFNFKMIGYEDGEEPWELPEYKEERIQRRQEAPVEKVHLQTKNLPKLEKSKTVAGKLVKNQLKKQSDVL